MQMLMQMLMIWQERKTFQEHFYFHLPLPFYHWIDLFFLACVINWIILNITT